MGSRRYYVYLGILAAVAAASFVANLQPIQIAHFTVYSSFIAGMLLFWRFKLAFGLAGIAALMMLGLLTTGTLVQFSGLDIVLFLAAMMIVIGFLEERHFFEHLLEKIMRYTGSSANRLVLMLMLMSALFAALVDEITSILFMAATVLHLTAKLNVRAVPFIIMVVFATNIGSSATAVGNPVGVLIALRAELTFLDFLRWATPISVAALAIVIPLALRYFARDIRAMDAVMKRQQQLDQEQEQLQLQLLQQRQQHHNGQATALASQTSRGGKSRGDIIGHDNGADHRQDYRLLWILFLGTIAALAAHEAVEHLLGLQRNVMLLGAAFAAAGTVLLIQKEKAKELVEKRVDWWTLCFFILLFASIGSLRAAGVTTILARGLYDASSGDETSLFLIFTLVAAGASAAIDNILAVATFIPIVDELKQVGDIHAYPLWWSLLFAATFFGNLTLIGSTANVIAIGMLERKNQGYATLVEWIKPGALVAVPTLALAILLIYAQIPLMPR